MTSTRKAWASPFLQRDVRSATRIDPYSGWVGTLFSVVLLGAYAHLISNHANGGGRVPAPFFDTLIGSELRLVGRDFYDVLLMLALAVAAMAGWERFTGIRRKLLWVAVTASALVHVDATVLSPQLTPVSVANISIPPITLKLGLMLLSFVGLFFFEVFAPEKRGNWTSTSFSTALRVGFSRWAAGFVVLIPYAALSLTHPYFGVNNLYRTFRVFLGIYLTVYVLLGLPWMVLSEWVRRGLDDPKKDVFFPILCFVVLGKRAIFGQKPRSRSLFARLMRRRFMRFAMLDLIVKGFFFPLMLQFMFSELGVMAEGFQLLRRGDIWNGSLYRITLHTILIIDVAIGAIGYIATSRWLKNKSVSVDPTAGGWAIALLCYPPFNSAAGTLFPYARGTGDWATPEINSVLQAIVLICFAVYTWATLAFGLRFSNLTNRGIIDHGPYRYVRHPAYISKSIAWWAEFGGRFSSPWHPIVMLLFCGVYGLRALSEERHLSADPEYRAYKKRVPYRFIPGVF